MTFAETIDRAVKTSPDVAHKIAKRAGVPASTLSSYRHGGRLPATLRKLETIIEALRLSEEDGEGLRGLYEREIKAKAIRRARGGGSDGK